mgnify:CR=1 FL=1
MRPFLTSYSTTKQICISYCCGELHFLCLGGFLDGKSICLISFFEKLGSIVEIVSTKYHDKILAITSHLPHLIAYTIVGTASDLETDLKNDVIKYCNNALPNGLVENKIAA